LSYRPDLGAPRAIKRKKPALAIAAA